MERSTNLEMSIMKEETLAHRSLATEGMATLKALPTPGKGTRVGQEEKPRVKNNGQSG